MTTRDRVPIRHVLAASVIPLASILGSGLLIIVPILEQTLGALAVFGAIGISAIAWVTGSVIRHNVGVVEPLEKSGVLDTFTARVGTASHLVIVVAYIISVALYLRIMAEYMVGIIDSDGSPVAERVIACVAVVIIVIIGVTRGFAGLDLLDRVALVVVLILTTVLGATLVFDDLGVIVEGSLSLPPIPQVDPLTTALILGGIVITVQGFETVRYLGDEFDGRTRIQASRLAQLVAASIYIGFVAVATPLMGLGTAAGADRTLLDITSRVAPFLAVPLVLSAVLSQFSAAVADTAAADGNLRGLSRWFHGWRPFAVTGVVAIVLAATVPTLAIVAIASRAFAAYYALQALMAVRTTRSWPRRIGFGAVGVLMAAIAIFAIPAG